MKKLICLFFAILLALNLSACGKNASDINNPFDKETQSKKLREGELIAENDKYSLLWVSSNCSVALVNKDNGKRYGTTPIKEGEPTVDDLGMPIKKHPQLESVLVVDCYDTETNLEEQLLSSTSAVKKGRVVTEYIKNGVRVKYYFDDSEIMIPVEYVLRDESVKLSIDSSKIQENKKRVTAVAIAPFWCSAENDADNSYLFYPSGSGALISNNTISQIGVAYSSLVYGNDPVIKDTEQETTEMSIRLPVYGAKAGDNATCAIIEQGAEAFAIDAKSGSTAIGYSAVFAKAQLRGYCPNIANFMKGLTKELNVYSDSMIKQKLSIGFYPLEGEKAGYVGMAEVYKNYLKSKGSLKKIKSDSALDITFVGGTMINKSFLGIPYKSLCPATTISQVKEILEDLSQKTDTKINARLIGFGDTGLDNNNYAGGFKINNNLGSKADLKRLNEYCEKNNISLYYDFDLIRLKSSSEGFSSVFDVSYSALGKIADIYQYDAATRSWIDSSKYHLLKRSKLSLGAEKLYKKFKGMGIGGISLSSLSNTAYSDYSDESSSKYYSKGSMEKDACEIIGKTFGKYNIAVSEANAYAALNANVIYESPTKSSKEQIFYTDIPFYQMVFKGFVGISGEYMNLAGDNDVQLLKLVESGCNLGYIVIGKYDNAFIDYKGYEFYNSQYTDISSSISESYDKLKEYYSAIDGAEIIGHTILENGLRQTLFSNGVKVYVNYLEHEIDGVEAGGFAWRDSI